MKYLIDTHILLWLLFSPKKLSRDYKSIILDANNQVFVSLISFWEISLKFSLGKLQLSNITPDKLPKIVEKSGIKTLDLSAETLSSFYSLPKLKHKDPFDRMIIWEAITNKCKLISVDKDFEKYKPYGLQVA